MQARDFIKIAEEHNSISSISEATLSRIVLYLISIEVKPGGPYKDNKRPDLTQLINSHASRLFSLKASEEDEMSQSLKIKQSKPAQNKDIDAIYDTVELELNNLTPEIRKIAHNILKKVKSSDATEEISNLSSKFPIHAKIPVANQNPSILKTLNIANIYTWLAYSLYDKVYDSTPPDTTLIPDANISLRRALQKYQEISPKCSIIAQELFEMSDTGQYEEITTCRFNPKEPIDPSKIPTSKNLKKLLYKRSAAHIIGPAYLMHINKDSSKIKKALLDYCAARQLLDDIHDWKDDFINGRWTYVTVELYKNAKIYANKDQPKAQSIKNTSVLGAMEQAFWDNQAESLLSYCYSLAEESKKNLNIISSNKIDSTFIEATLNPIIKSSLDGLSELEKLKNFTKNIQRQLPK